MTRTAAKTSESPLRVTAEKFLLQMSGAPGAGKSTVAAFVARELSVARIDYDVVKSALLPQNEIDDLGAASYRVVLALAESFLAQGLSVVVDSPCYYTELLAKGQSIARAHEARYRYVECRAPLDTLAARLRSRSRLPSQRAGLNSPPDGADASESAGRELFTTWIEGMKRPDSGYLVLDTSRPLEHCQRDVLTYLR